MATKGSRESLRRLETSMLTAVVPVTATAAPVVSRMVGRGLADVADQLVGADAVGAGGGEDGDDALRRVAGGLGRQDGLDVLEGRQLLGHLSAGL